jgi:predicted CXXCH cytochrome family protein
MPWREKKVMGKRAYFILTVMLFGWVSTVGICLGEPACFKCHERASFENKVVHAPVAGDRCTACHNPHVARFKGLLSFKADDLCYSCHGKEAASYRQGTIHQPVRQGNCLSCHDPHVSATKGLIKGRLSDRCFSCHESLQEKYTYPHAPFGKGDCLACHRPHAADNNQLLISGPEKICLPCHPGQQVKQAHKNYPLAIKECLSCHDPHGSNRRGIVRNFLHKGFAVGCNDCHKKGGNAVDTDTCIGCHAEKGKAAYSIHNHATAPTGNSCTNCHSPHGGDTADLLKAKQRQVCRDCHEDTYARYGEKAYIHPAIDENCSKCHAVHGSNSPAMLKGDGVVICSQCHATQGKFTHPLGEKAKDPRNGQKLTCITCHNPHGTSYKNQLILNGQKVLCIQCHQTY